MGKIKFCSRPGCEKPLGEGKRGQRKSSLVKGVYCSLDCYLWALKNDKK